VPSAAALQATESWRDIRLRTKKKVARQTEASGEFKFVLSHILNLGCFQHPVGNRTTKNSHESRLHLRRNPGRDKVFSSTLPCTLHSTQLNSCTSHSTQLNRAPTHFWDLNRAPTHFWDPKMHMFKQEHTQVLTCAHFHRKEKCSPSPPPGRTPPTSRFI